MVELYTPFYFFNATISKIIMKYMSRNKPGAGKFVL